MSRLTNDKELGKELDAQSCATTAGFDVICPKVSDEATLCQVVAVVEKTTSRIEDFGQLKFRLATLCDDVLKMAKEAEELI